MTYDAFLFIKLFSITYQDQFSLQDRKQMLTVSSSLILQLLQPVLLISFTELIDLSILNVSGVWISPNSTLRLLGSSATNLPSVK